MLNSLNERQWARVRVFIEESGLTADEIREKHPQPELSQVLGRAATGRATSMLAEHLVEEALASWAKDRPPRKFKHWYPGQPAATKTATKTKKKRRGALALSR